MREQAVRQRTGGREARRRLRQADGCSPAVRPGLEGGAYRPLGERDMERIHETALDLLETIGMGDPIPEFREVALDRGCSLTRAGRLRFPRALVEDVIAGAGRDFVIHARDPAHDIDVSGARVHFGCGGEAVTVLDFETGRYRPSTLVDFYDLARLTDRLEHVHRYSNIIVPTDIADLREMDINRSYAAVAGTTKACSMSVSKAGHMDDVIAMFDVMLGGEGRFLARPFANAGGCAIVSPLCYGEDNSEIVVAATRRGITTSVVVASQAGATAPAALAGALVQNTAETLAGLLLVNLVRPGHPMMFGNWPFVSDLRTGSFSGGGGEEAVLTAAAAQMGNFYDLPTSVGAGMTDSKLSDAQAGYEKGLTTALAGLAGANIVAEAVGMVGSLMGASFEAMVIDDDMLGAVNRAVRGIEVTDETLSYEVIREAVEGPGHFLGNEQTLALMESEYLYPRIGDRRPPAEWEEDGALSIVDRARVRVREILSAHYPDHVDAPADARVRERFPIHLAREDMLPGNGRW